MTHDTFRKLDGYKKISEGTEKYSKQSVTNGSLEDMTGVMGRGCDASHVLVVPPTDPVFQ